MSNRDTAWALLDRVVELYTPEAQKDHDDYCRRPTNREKNKQGILIETAESKIISDRLLGEYRAKYHEFFAAILETFIFLEENFPLGELTEDEIIELISETKGLFRGEIGRETVSDKCFPLVVMTDAMKNRRLPVANVSEWVEFAKQWTNIIAEQPK